MKVSVATPGCPSTTSTGGQGHAPHPSCSSALAPAGLRETLDQSRQELAEPLRASLSFKHKLILYGKARATWCPRPPYGGGCGVMVLHSGAHAETSLPRSQTRVCGFLIKAFKVEKRLISTLLPPGVGALIAYEQKIKWNYLSSDTRQRDSRK